MLGVIANGVCCCFGTTANITKQAFSKSIKLSYIGISLLFSLFIIFATFYGDQIIKVFAQFIGCFKDDDVSVCLGISLIVRISLALLIFHLIIALLLFTRDNFARFLNEECFVVKILTIVAIVILLMFVKNSYLVFFVKTSQYLSVLFLIYQSIMLIDFGYSWNELWVDKFEQGTTFYGVLLVFFSLLLLAANVGIVFLNAREFWISGCAFNKFTIIFAVIMFVVFIVLVILKINEQSSILTAMFISLLYSYLSGIALNSQVSAQCNPRYKVTNLTDYLYGFLVHVIINLVLAFVTIAFASMSEESSKNFQNAKMDVVNNLQKD